MGYNLGGESVCIRKWLVVRAIGESVGARLGGVADVELAALEAALVLLEERALGFEERRAFRLASGRRGICSVRRPIRQPDRPVLVVVLLLAFATELLLDE